MLVTLHTVLPHPTQKMKEVTSEIVKLARIIVVLTEQSKKIIEQLYPEASAKVFVIPHGIHPTIFETSETYKAKLELKHHIVLSTFGLLSRGKGIEYVINALPSVINTHPSILYIILGKTHPVIRRKEGEEYRIKLIKLVNKLGLQKNVKFYDQYLNLPDLFTFLKATDIYISSSTNPNQAVSGTLSYALGTGRAVISTQFAQAKEIVTADVGRLIPIKDSAALTNALLDLLHDKKKLKQMHLSAYKKTRSMLWNKVAEKYINILTQYSIPLLNTNHLKTMTDDFGLFQFASFTLPNKDYGYTLDDNARALIACSWFIKKKYTKELKNFIDVYFNFVKKCQQKNGSFINYIGFKDKSPTLQNSEENLEDAQGRALWALSEVMSNKTLSLTLRNEAKKMFLSAINIGSHFTHLRARAFTIKSFALASIVLPKYRKQLLHCVQEHSDFLVHALKQNSYKSWNWFEDHLRYSNGVLPESLLIAGDIVKNSSYTDKGISSLMFLISKTFSSHMYRPIGNSRWYKNNQKRSHYDQQPEDPASMICALVRAYKTTHDEEYKSLAKKCFSWFLGNNTLKMSLYDNRSGGCYDGLRPNHVNLNQGAESLVSFLMSNYIIKELQ